MSKTIKACDLHARYVQCLASNEFVRTTVYTLRLSCCIEYRFEYDYDGSSRIEYPHPMQKDVLLLKTDSLELFNAFTKQLRKMSNVQLLEFLRLRRLTLSQEEIESLPGNRPRRQEILLKARTTLVAPAFDETSEDVLLLANKQ